MDLPEWEKQLQPYLRQIELIGEIPLGRTEHAEIEEAVGKFVCQHGLTKATRRLQREYPAVFVTYLAFKAAHNEEQGFWRQVAQVIGLETPHSFFNSTHHWGKAFKEIVQSYPNLRQFEGVSGLEFITPIRLHGGIPAFSLPDFFKHILLPSVQNPHYAGLDDEATLAALLERSSVDVLVDDIVRHFFRHGGEPAQRFFHKCRQMARLAIAGEPLPAAEALGLRPYVLQAFEQYLQNPPEPAQRRRLPRLFFEPYEPAFRLLLPAQPISLEEAGHTYSWQIRGLKEDQPIFEGSVKTAVRRRGAEWQTAEQEYWVTEPAEHLQVSLVCQTAEGEKAILRRTLRLLPAAGAPPVLAFRFADNTPYSFAANLPAQTVWLFYPADVALEFEGEARTVQALHPFPPPWDAWQAQAWDLQNVHLVYLLRDGEDVCPPLPVRLLEEPTLAGQPVHPHSLAVDELPLFRGAPQVRIPLRSIQNAQGELDDWSLALEAEGVAYPPGRWEGKASELPARVQPEENVARLDLTPWLGPEPIGSFDLVVRRSGRDRVEYSLPFRVWPELQIEGLRSYYLPNPQGAEESSFKVQLPEGCQLKALREEVQVDRLGQGWQVRVSPKADQADLLLEYPAQPEAVCVPLKLALPRLRWALQTESSAAIEWQNRGIRLQLADLLQKITKPRLRVALPLREAETLRVTLQLRTPPGGQVLQTSDPLEISPLKPEVEFRLDGYLDTLRSHLQEVVFDFVLELSDSAGDPLRTLPVLRLTQELEITVPPYFESRAEGRWRVHWFEPNPLRYRRLRLWSLWQPWADPIEIPLPDDAPASDACPDEGWWMAEVPAEVSLPPAWYRVQFLAFAPDDKPPIPPEPPKNSIQVELIEPNVRLKQIEQELTQHPQRAFPLYAEKACIYDSLGFLSDRDEAIQWCLSHWNEGSLLHLFALQRWLAERDPHTRRAFLMHLLREESLEKLRGYPLDFIQGYLALMREAKTIRAENAWQILHMATTPDVFFMALKMLVKAQDAGVIDYIWQAIQAGRLSESDAIHILLCEPPFAVDELLKKEDIPLRSRLLIELSQHCYVPEIVRLGYWAYSDAGWGEIVEIRRANRADAFLRGKEHPLLVINLWGKNSMQIEVDLATRKMKMQGRKAAYLCKCGRFIAPRDEELREVWKNHEMVCKRVKDADPIPFPYQVKKRLIYSPFRPKNVYGKLPNDFETSNSDLED